MGFASFECPVCNKSVLHEGLTNFDEKLDDGWSDATLVLTSGVLQGSYDGYGKIDDNNIYALAVHGKPESLSEEDEEEFHAEWDSGSGNNKMFPVKLYHTYCWENSGKPNFRASKASKSAKDQGHFISPLRYSKWPPEGPRANPAKEGAGGDSDVVIRLEYTEGTSNKFWEYSDMGNGDALLRWGPIGKQGQSQVKTLKEAEKRAAAKQKKGYTQVEAAFKGRLRTKLAIAGIKTYRNHQGRSFIRRVDLKRAMASWAA